MASPSIGGPRLETLLDLLDDAVAANGDKTALSLRLDDGSTTHWSYRELDRRSRIAAWRLRALGLEPGDRLLTWSPSTPELPAAYFGAMRARLVLVPLDLRMSADAIEGIVRASGARHLVLGTGPRRPGPARSRPGPLPDDGARRDRRPTPTTRSRPTGRPSSAAWARPPPSDVFELVFTSGTTGTPKGVMLAHDNVIASIESFHRLVPPMEHRIVSLLPLSHLLEQSVGLYYALVGRGRHPVRAEPQPAGHLRRAARPPGHLDGRRPPGPRPVLERHRARGRQARPRDRVRAPARRSPGGCRSARGRACSAASTSSWAAISGCSCRPGPSCRRRSSRAGRTSA